MKVQSLDWTGGMDYDSGQTYNLTNPINPVSAPGRSKITVGLGLDGDGLGDCTVTFTQPSASASAQTASAITQLPGQPAITAYGSSSAVTPFGHKGALA
jgi:hypothetical protein